MRSSLTVKKYATTQHLSKANLVIIFNYRTTIRISSLMIIFDSGTMLVLFDYPLLRTCGTVREESKSVTLM